jgi:hypothetical protein
MWKDFTIIQCHTPNGISSMYWGGIIFRFKGNYPDKSDAEIKQFLLTESAKDFVYTKNYTLQDAISQSKQYKMKLIVNMNEVFREDIPLVSSELFGKVAGIIADILIENGFNDETSAITLINEPKERWHMTEMQYVQYCYRANKYVEGRLPLILSNDEYHRWDEKIIFEQTATIPKRMFGVHHLSSLDSEMKNVEYAKTQANEWKVPIICIEGGSWFKDYQKSEGHAINKKLIEECYKFDYEGCSICLPEINEVGRQAFKTLGYRIWNNNYSAIKSSNNWTDFENFIKKYKEVIMTEYLRPTDLQAVYDAMDLKTPYNWQTPNLYVVGKKDPNKQVTWGDIDAMTETQMKALIHALKTTGALPVDFPDYPNIKYNANGTWNPLWQVYAKSNPKI